MRLPSWLKQREVPATVPDDADERRAARTNSLDNLERAVRTSAEIQPMAETLIQHDRNNHYIARLALSYGGKQ